MVVVRNRNKFSWKITLAVLFFLVLSPSQINAQLGLYTGVDSYYDDNIYNNYLGVSDFINSFSFGANYDFESENNNLGFYYDGNLTYFNENIFKS